MQTSTQDRDIDPLLTHYKSISFIACTLSLYDRSSQGKKIGIRSQSMLPQITIPPSILKALLSTSKSTKTGLFPTCKLSPTHYLSLTGCEIYWPENPSPIPSDFLIYMRPTSTTRISDHLYHDEKLLDFFYANIEKSCFHSHQTLEVLDLCRAMVLFCKDKYLGLLVRCEILFPHTNLLFNPILPMKLVSCPLTKRLIMREEGFNRGYLTMDQQSRIVPLDVTDPMVAKYPIVGIWVKGVPMTNSANVNVSLVHPLVWSACIQFILNKEFKEKVTACSTTCSFLFIDFSDKVKFYEVSCQKPPAWKTTSFSAEIPDSANLQPLVVQFLKKDTRMIIKNSLSSIYESVTSLASRSTTPPSAKPPTHKVLRSSGSAKQIPRTRSYDKIIVEQTKLIEKLQVKVQKLQQQISPKSRSYTEASDNSGSFKNSIETNITESMMQDLQKSHKRLNFDTEEDVCRNQIYGSHKIQTASSRVAGSSSSGLRSSDQERQKLLQRVYLTNNRK